MVSIAKCLLSDSEPTRTLIVKNMPYSMDAEQLKDSVRTAPGKSWNLIFKFSRPWKLLENDLSPGNSWNFYKVLLEFLRLSNVHTLTVKFTQSCMNDHFPRFLSFGHAFSKLNQYCIIRYTRPANFSRGSDTM
jgi:hypothetical protein